MERKNLRTFILTALIFSLMVAFFLSPFASSSPDGLERTAENLGFIERAEGNQIWQHSPIPDYEIKGIKNPILSTGIAGLAGTLAVFGAAWLIFWSASRRNAKKIIAEGEEAPGE